jgi:hypothetical protein
MSDPATAYDRLRTETAEMLKLNIADLSLVEGLQLDLVSMLRLEVDGLQGAVLAGGQVDLARLSTALGMLRQLLPEKSLVASPAAAPETRLGPDHRARLRDLIERTVLREDPREAERMRDIQAREEMAAVIAAGGTVEVATPPPPRPAENVVPFDPNSVKPPQHYLKQHEPWESHYDGRAGPPAWPLP